MRTGEARGVAGFFAHMAVALIVCGAFVLGCFLDFLKHPLAWLSVYWLPWSMILVGLIGGLRSARKRRNYR